MSGRRRESFLAKPGRDDIADFDVGVGVVVANAIDPADGQSLTLFLQSPIYVEGNGPNEESRCMTLDKEDRTFALARTDTKACQAYKPVVE